MIGVVSFLLWSSVDAVQQHPCERQPIGLRGGQYEDDEYSSFVQCISDLLRRLNPLRCCAGEGQRVRHHQFDNSAGLTAGDNPAGLQQTFQPDNPTKFGNPAELTKEVTDLVTVGNKDAAVDMKIQTVFATKIQTWYRRKQYEWNHKLFTLDAHAITQEYDMHSGIDWSARVKEIALNNIRLRESDNESTRVGDANPQEREYKVETATAATSADQVHYGFESPENARWQSWVAHEKMVSYAEDRALKAHFDIEGQAVDLFCVFDGHGGEKTSDFLARNFAKSFEDVLKLMARSYTDDRFLTNQHVQDTFRVVADALDEYILAPKSVTPEDIVMWYNDRQQEAQSGDAIITVMQVTWQHVKDYLGSQSAEFTTGDTLTYNGEEIRPDADTMVATHPVHGSILLDLNDCQTLLSTKFGTHHWSLEVAQLSVGGGKPANKAIKSSAKPYSGSTAGVALVANGQVFLAGVGDSIVAVSTKAGATQTRQHNAADTPTERLSGTLNSDEAEKLRVFFNRAKLESPDVVVFEVHQPEEDGDHPIIFVFHTDADVQAAMEAVLRTSENLQKLRDFNYGSSHEFYPSDVMVGLDSDDEGNFLVSISLNPTETTRFPQTKHRNSSQAVWRWGGGRIAVRGGPACGVTRSFGDKYLKPGYDAMKAQCGIIGEGQGLNHVFEFAKTTPTAVSDVQYLIGGSDGVWDVMDVECAKLFLDEGEEPDALEALKEYVTTKWDWSKILKPLSRREEYAGKIKRSRAGMAAQYQFIDADDKTTFVEETMTSLTQKLLEAASSGQEPLTPAQRVVTVASHLWRSFAEDNKADNIIFWAVPGSELGHSA